MHCAAALPVVMAPIARQLAVHIVVVGVVSRLEVKVRGRLSGKFPIKHSHYIYFAGLPEVRLASEINRCGYVSPATRRLRLCVQCRRIWPLSCVIGRKFRGRISPLPGVKG